MTYQLLKPTPDGLQQVGRYAAYQEARATSWEGHEYTAVEIHPAGYVEIEDGDGQTLYLITWSYGELTEDNTA